MEESILKSTKKILGLADDYTVFDHDIIVHINSAFTTLAQLGVGPPEGFMITDATPVWSDFTDDVMEYNSVRSYMFLKVKRIFDPPSTSYLSDAMDRQIAEMEWRLNTSRESKDWVSPFPPEIVEIP